MRVFFLTVLTITALCLLAQVGEAALATALLFKDQNVSTVDNLEDRDFERAIQNDANATVDVGDYLYGYWEVSTVNSVRPGDVGADYFVALFAVRVKSVNLRDFAGNGFTPGDDFYEYGLEASSAAWTAAFGFTPNKVGTTAIIYSDADALGETGTNFSPSVANVDTSQKLWEFGFTGSPTYSDTDSDFIFRDNVGPEYWVAKANSNNIADLYGGANALIYWGAMNLLDENTSLLNGIQLLPFSFDPDGSGANTAPSQTAQLFIDGVNTAELNNAGTPNDPTDEWLMTQTTLHVNSTPEPSTWVALVGLVLMGLVWRWRRSK